MKWHSTRLAADALDADGFGASYAPSGQQHLVVEARTDDRWRVALCTTLDDLDAALDSARTLRADPSIDEVCLALETAGSHGREIRREVIRLGGEAETAAAAAREAAPPSTSGTAAISNRAPEQAIEGGIAAILPAIKAPDYEIDQEILDALKAGPALDADRPRRPSARDNPVPATGDSSDAPGEAEARAAARALVNSLYGLESEAGNDTESDAEALSPGADERLDFTSLERLAQSSGAAAHDNEAADTAEGEDANPSDASDGNWLDGLDGAHPAAFSQARRLEAGDTAYDAAARLERPLIGDPSGAATKAFLVAGTLAMMVLGGALAELLAFDLTTTAKAGTGPATVATDFASR